VSRKENAGRREQTDDRTTVPPHDAAHADLERTYRRHHGFVWRTLYRLGVPDPSVDDAVHDVFVVATRRLHELDGRAAVTTWLFAVAVRVAQHHRRAYARHRRRQEAVASARTDRVSDGEAFARSDAARTIHQLLEHLEDPLRHVFILMELEQMTGREVAAVLGLKIPTVHTRLRAARRRIREVAHGKPDDDVRRSA
jgi:RNA polymerase sigma-70 factor (ECF subfamily)